MDRRKFIKQTVCASSIMMLPKMSWSMANYEGNTKPNIVFIMTDQQTFAAMSNTGNKYLKTPNIDRLAKHGTSFSNAYCTQPLCGPSRSSIFTGQYPHQIKASVNLPEKENYWDSDMPMLGKIMQDANYDTAYIGKWHLPIPVSSISQHGFSFIRNTTRRDWQDSSIPADCGEFLKQKRDKPFFMVSSFVNPHDICEWARGGHLRMDNIQHPPDPELCPPLPFNLEIPDNEPQFLREMHLLSPKQYPSVGWDNGKWRQYLWAYYRLVEKVDSYIGHVIESLERTNNIDNTIIIFTSDHGDGAGSHRWNQKQVLYQEVINVPFIISNLSDNNTKASVNNNAKVNIGIDLIPTICDFAGISVPSTLSGLSMRKHVNANTSDDREYIVCETEFAENEISFGLMSRSVFDGRYKYIIYRGVDSSEQLFDLKHDKGEQVNLSDIRKYAKHKKRLTEYFLDWQKQTKDSKFIF